MKNHHTRLFQSDRDLQDKSMNPAPGTVVDSGITNPSLFDFFLLSHAGIQGTSRPTYYCVLWDDNKFVLCLAHMLTSVSDSRSVCSPCSFQADQFQRLTYGLCHVYQQCTRSISMVAPVYYAVLHSRTHLLSIASLILPVPFRKWWPCARASTFAKALWVRVLSPLAAPGYSCSCLTLEAS